MQVLFESRPDIVRREGKLLVVQSKPQVHPEPVLQLNPDGPDAAGSKLYGSVLHDGGVYRMWYQAVSKEWTAGNASYVGYAESDDGLAWRKPSLNLVEFAGSRSNNLCDLSMHIPTVWIDPHAKPSHRYRATAHQNRDAPGANVEAEDNGYYLLHSSDGLHWELDSKKPVWPGHDTIRSVYHPQRQCGAVMFKQMVHVRGFQRRAVWEAAVVDGEPTEARCAMVPDDFDDVCAMTRGYASADHYSMAMLPAGQGMVGFLEQFRHSYPRTQGWKHGVFGVIDVSLVYQHKPGERWLHQPGRPDWLTHGCLDMARGWWHPASFPVVIGDKHRLYLSGNRFTHAYALDEQWKKDDALIEEMYDGGFARITFCDFPRYRLFGFESDPKAALAIELSEVEPGSVLHLNYCTRGNGFVKTKLWDGKQIIAESQPMNGDKVDAVVVWGDKATLPVPAGQKVNLRIELDHAQVWAFDVRRAD